VCLEVEFREYLGREESLQRDPGLVHQNFTFDLTGFTAAMASIHFVQDEVGATSYTVETKGLSYIPPVPGAVYNASLITTLPGDPVVAASHGTTSATDNATITPAQGSTTVFSAVSNVPDKGDFTFSQTSWGYFQDSNNDGTPDEPRVFIGTGASLGSSVTLALSGTAGRVLKVEFVNISA